MWCVGCSRNDWLWDSRARGWLRGPKAPKSRSSYAILSSSFDLAPARHEIKQKHPHQTYRDTTHAQYFFTGTYVTVTVPATLWHVGEPGSDLDLSNVSLSGAHPAGTSLTHSTKRLQSLYLPTSFLPLLCVPVCPSRRSFSQCVCVCCVCVCVVCLSTHVSPSSSNLGVCFENLVVFFESVPIFFAHVYTVDGLVF